MNNEEVILTLQVENERLKKELEDALKTIDELKEVISNHKVGRTKTVTTDVEVRIVELRQEGFTMREVANTLGVSLSSVQRVCKKFDINRIKKSK